MSIIDLFAGARGWEASSDIDALGIEWDADACATSLAAGFRTLEADVAALDPLGFAPCVGLIASAPCQAFSNAGLGAGRAAMAAYEEAIAAMADGREVDWQAIRSLSADERGHLVLEPLRWALALRPRWIALEQVEPVLPLWQAMATALRGKGYSAWCGVLSAERFGVPQTRRRAILIASLDREVSEPPPTHQRYVAPKRREEATGALFAAPEPERIVVPEDAHLLPWVSMAEALGWGMTARPSVALLAKVGGTGGNRPLEGGSGARQTLDRAREDGYWAEGPAPAPAPTVTAGGTGAGGGVEVFASREARERAASAVEWVQRSNYSDGSSGSGTAEERGRTERPIEAPSVAVTSKGFQWVSNNLPNAARRNADEPAPTITAGHDSAERRWVVPTNNFTAIARDPDGKRSKAGSVPYERPVDEPAPTVDTSASGWKISGQARNSGPGAEREPRPLDAPSFTIRAAGSGMAPGGVAWVQTDNTKPDGERVMVRPIPVDEPAPTIGADGLSKGRDVWVSERPATTVNCDPRVAEPGRHDPAQPGSQYGAATVRVTIQEAAVLQSFPPDWPWMGTKTARFRQVGNAICPLLAWHILKALGVLPGAMTPREHSRLHNDKHPRIKVCESCGNEYEPAPTKRARSRTCSRECFRELMRQRRGGAMGSAKLTEADVVAIRQRVAAGEQQKVLGAEYGVSAAAMSQLVNRKTWRHVA